MMPITRQSEHYLGDTVRHSAVACAACGESGPTRMHAAVSARLCVECAAIADDMAGLASGPAIPTGMNR